MRCSIPRVKTCCCGCSLSTGSRMIAAGWLIFFVVGTGGCVFIAVKEDLDFKMSGGGVLGIIIFILVNIFLLLGATKRKPSLLLPYLFLELASTVGEAIAVPILILLIFLLRDVVWIMLGAVACVLLIMAVRIYLAIVVYSFYMELKEERQAKRNPKPDVGQSGTIPQPPPYPIQAGGKQMEASV